MSSGAQRDCSNGPVTKSWAFPGYLVRDGQKSDTFALLPLATAESIARLRPKPYLEMSLPTATAVSRVGLRQRQMAFGDATIKRVRLLNGGGVQVAEAEFGPPSVGCETGTCLTRPDVDAYGRQGQAAEVHVTLPAGTSLDGLRVVVEEVYDYEPPAHLASPLRWEGEKGTLSQTCSSCVAITAPDVRSAVRNKASSTGASFVEFTSAEWEALSFDGELRSDHRVVISRPNGNTVYGDPIPDETFTYRPRPYDVALDDVFWGVSGVELEFTTFHEYIYETKGSWNFGFTSVTLYDDELQPVDRSLVDAASFSASDPSGCDGKDAPFRYAYDLHPAPPATVSSTVLPSWCWLGILALRGGYGHVVIDNAPPSPPFSPDEGPVAEPTPG